MRKKACRAFPMFEFLTIKNLKNFVWRSEAVLCQTKRGAKHSPFFEKDCELTNELSNLAAVWIVCLVLHLATSEDDDEMLVRPLSAHEFETPFFVRIENMV